MPPRGGAKARQGVICAWWQLVHRGEAVWPRRAQEAWGRVVDMFPEVECVINNAGVQKPIKFGGDGPLDITVGDAEIDTNFRRHVFGEPGTSHHYDHHYDREYICYETISICLYHKPRNCENTPFLCNADPLLAREQHEQRLWPCLAL